MTPSVEAFDEAKYKALMDGVDFEEIFLSRLENGLTIGAEYYGQKYVSAANAVKNLFHKQLGEISDLITDGDHGSPDYQESGVLYLLSECIRCGYIETSNCRYITHEKNKELKRSELHPGDVVVTKTGVYYGKSAVIPEEIRQANTIAHVGKITLKEGYNPYYVSTFLNSKYGYYQLRRRGIKATRPEIKLVEFPEILIPLFSEKLNSVIERTVKDALRLLSAARESMSSCESVLEKEVIGTRKLTNKNYTTKKFSSTIHITGRLDSEYYQPKYDEYRALVFTYSNGYTYVKNEFAKVTQNCNFTNTEYPYIEIGDVDVSSGTASFTIINTDQLPANAKIMTKSCDVLVSTVRPNRGAVAILDYDNLLVSGAFTVLRQKSSYKTEVLQALLRTKLYRNWLLQYNVGTSYPVIKDEDVLNMPIPVFDQSIQDNIAAKVQESFAFRRKAKEKLEYAKLAIELAIEKDESTALVWLNKKLSEQEC